MLQMHEFNSRFYTCGNITRFNYLYFFKWHNGADAQWQSEGIISSAGSSAIKANECNARLYTHCNLASPVLIMASVRAAMEQAFSQYYNVLFPSRSTIKINECKPRLYTRSSLASPASNFPPFFWFGVHFFPTSLWISLMKAETRHFSASQ